MTEWWIGLAAGMIPGGGQLYARRPVRALLAAALFAFVLLPASIEIPLVLASPFAVTLVGYALGFAALLPVALDGAFQAMTRSRRAPVPWTRWGLLVPLSIALVAVTCVLLFPRLPLRRFRIPAVSMEPTLRVGDVIATDVRPVRLESLDRGDLVVFENPTEAGMLVMKRVVALPGDSIEVREGIAVLNGAPLGSAPSASGPVTETDRSGRTYTVQRDTRLPANDMPPLTVPEGHCFILGDNRMNSRDSRSFGFVPEDALRGRPYAIHWSTDPKTGATRWDRIGTSLRPGVRHE